MDRDGDTRAAIETRLGGSAANTAVWLASLGVEVDFVGRAGGDVWAAEHAAAFRAAGVAAHLIADPARPTGCVVVLAEADGSRTMFSDRGANLAFRPDDLPAMLFRPGSHLHLTGHTLLWDETRAVGQEALKLARQTGMTVSLDPSAAALLRDVGPERFLEWTRGADYIFPNLEEGRALTGRGEPTEVAEALGERYGEVLLKLGAAGALWYARGASPILLAVASSLLVESTGAGDAFSAGFLSRRLRGATARESLACALETAALAIGRLGARPA